MLSLYGFPLSTNVFKVRMLLDILGLPYDETTVDLPSGEQRGAAYRALNPLGKVPVLVDGGLAVRESNAILIYLARRAGADSWWPSDAAGQALILQWLFFAGNELLNGPARARLHALFNLPVDIIAVREAAHAAIAVVEQRLQGRDWLELDRPTLADLACAPYIGLAHQGGVSLGDYPAARGWVARVKALSAATMPGW